MATKSKAIIVYRPIESKMMIDKDGTGYPVRVFRGTEADRMFEPPHWMNGIDFRKWRKNMKQEVYDYVNYVNEEEPENEANVEKTSLD